MLCVGCLLIVALDIGGGGGLFQANCDLGCVDLCALVSFTVK